jgi:hypothetical protein
MEFVGDCSQKKKLRENQKLNIFDLSKGSVLVFQKMASDFPYLPSSIPQY